MTPLFDDLFARLERLRDERDRIFDCSGDDVDQALAEAVRLLRPVVEVLEEARENLKLAAAIPLADPHILVELRSLCERAGYGNVMASASALWRERLGDLAGGEFVAGPCRSTADACLAKIDAVLAGVKS